MKNLKTKFATVMLVVSCAFAGVGATNIMFSDAYNVGITANAETNYTEYNVSNLTVHVHSTEARPDVANASSLWLSGTSDTSDAWADYTYESGDGIKLNGEAANVRVQDFSCGLYLSFDAVNVDDVISIGGTFINEARAIRYNIPKTQYFKWNGSGWEKHIVCEQFNVGKLTVKSGDASSVYFRPADSTVTLPIDSWEAPFSYVSGNGITVNGTMINMENSVKSPSGDFYVGLGQTVSTGAILKIGGVFRCEAFTTDYVIEECSFTWNGSAWVDYVEGGATGYTEYNVGTLTVNPNSVPGAEGVVNTSLYLVKQNGSTVDDWTRYTYVSGAGFKVNGETATLNAIQNVGSGLYLSFEGVSEGDVISIEGTYVCEDTMIKYFIPESKFVWTGAGWENVIEYTEYSVSNLTVHLHSTADNENSNNTTLWLFGTNATSDSWGVCANTAGDGVKLNGESVEATVKEFSGGLHLEFAAVNTDDVISISGTFVCEASAIRYVVDEAKFIWNGSGWEKEYATYELGTIEPNVNSATVGAASARPDHLYTMDVAMLPVIDWESPFVLESGYGVKINGEEVTSFEIKSTDGGLWFGLSGVQTNDVVSICGTFKNEEYAVKYVIEESKMVWNGAAWEKFVEYTAYEIGALKLSATTSSETAVYLSKVNGEKMPVDSWDYVFRFRQGSGTGLTLNNEALNTNDIKAPNGDLYIGLGLTAKEGDVLVIGGTFYCVNLAIEYKIEDSTFIFENSAWISEIDKEKKEAKDELDVYRATFVQENYYDSEWASFDAIVEAGKGSIDAAMTSEEIASIVESVKAEMDDVVTKEESDAIFNELKQSVKVDLANYKSESDYRAGDWATIQTVITNASAQIDASASVTEINTVVENAKAEMDAVKTSAQRDADDAVVANAKADLAAYKSESDYRANDWAIIQTIIANAGAQIDEVIGNETAIGEIVVSAKEDIDAVKTRAQRDADDAAVANAKADLASYKSAVDYRDAQWAEIQAIITKANGDIDLAVGDQTAIDAIVANAKKDVDKVKTSKTVAKDEVREYYGAIDHSLYSEEAEEIISGYMAEVMTAIDSATTNEQIDTAIAEFKGKVEKVETLNSAGDSSEEEDSGCTGSTGAIGLTAILGLVGVVSLIRRKKEER